MRVAPYRNGRSSSSLLGSRLCSALLSALFSRFPTPDSRRSKPFFGPDLASRPKSCLNRGQNRVRVRVRVRNRLRLRLEAGRSTARARAQRTLAHSLTQAQQMVGRIKRLESASGALSERRVRAASSRALDLHWRRASYRRPAPALGFHSASRRRSLASNLFNLHQLASSRIRRVAEAAWRTQVASELRRHRESVFKVLARAARQSTADAAAAAAACTAGPKTQDARRKSSATSQRDRKRPPPLAT